MAQCVQRVNDIILHVSHDTHFAQIDAKVGHVIGDVADILVLRAPGQNLVTDDKDRGCNRLGR